MRIDNAHILVRPGSIAIVDPDDCERLARWSWRLHMGGYATRHTHVNYKPTTYFMHRVVMDAPSDMEVHHLNGNRLDNRKSNLMVISAKWHRLLHRGDLLIAVAEKYRKRKPLAVCKFCGAVYLRRHALQSMCSSECRSGATTKRNTKLSLDVLREVRRLYGDGIGCAEISRRLPGVTRENAAAICHGRSWKTVQ